jgi:hypothetical protein
LKAACAKQSSRHDLDKIHIDSKRQEIVASNGRQLLIIDFGTEKSIFKAGKPITGLYSPLDRKYLVRRPGIGNYVDYPSVIPDISMATPVYEGDLCTGFARLTALPDIILEVLNYANVIQALAALCNNWKFYGGTPHKPIVVISDMPYLNIKYLMMPSRISSGTGT